MKLMDFVYDDVNLSDFGMIPCSFNGDSDSQNIGNEMDMHETKSARSDRYWAIGAQYSNPYKTEFSIVKDPCAGDEWSINDEELNELMRWLNRRTYKRFIPVYEDGEFSDAYYMASFNVTVETAAGCVIGLNLAMTTDSPYAYLDEVTYSGDCSLSEPLAFDDDSTEIGYLYPEVKITVSSGGDLELINSQEPTRKTIIRNCVANEVITFNGELKQAAASGHVYLADDFNYKFPRIVNTYENVTNSFTTSLPCRLEITYSPISKVGLIL